MIVNPYAFASTAPVDPSWSSVSTLLHCDGSNGGAITDQKGKTWTGNSGAAIDTGDQKFGTASLLFDGTDDYVTTPDHADFNFGSGDWTVEFFFKEASQGSTRQIIGHHSTTGEIDSSFILYSDTGVLTLSAYVGYSTYTIVGSSSHSTGTWYHVAAVRDGGTLRLFRNGASLGTISISGSLNDAAQPVTIGSVMSGGAPAFSLYLHGRVDEVRVTKGVARYTSAFTAPTAAFPDS